MKKLYSEKVLFIIFLILFCLGMSCVSNRVDNDLWARLIAGGHIVEKLSILKYDIFSYTKTHLWYDHEWGASVFFYLVFKYFSDSGLIIFKGILTTITILLCYKTVELRQPKSTHSYNIIYYAVMFLAVYKSLGPDIRCLLFTCLFFALFLYLLESVRQGKTLNLIFLPIIMLFWCNIHGGCISGLGLLIIYIAGEFLNKKPIKNYLITLFFCLAVLFINPYGYEYVKFLFKAALMNREYITEWSSPFCKYYLNQYLHFKFYFILMLITQIIYLIKSKTNYNKLDKTKILIILTVTYLSITHLRHQSFFVFTAGTLLYDEFYSIFNSIMIFISNRLNIKQADTISSIKLFKEILVYCTIFLLAYPPLAKENKLIKITESGYPRFAIEFIKINKIHGNLFINFDWGSYAAYKLYPNNLIVMDGRYEEVYDPSLLIELKNFHLVRNDWYKIIRDYKTDVMILEKKYPVFNVMLNHPDWILVFENNLSGVFVPIDKIKDKYILPKVDDIYYDLTKFNTNIKFIKSNGNISH